MSIVLVLVLLVVAFLLLGGLVRFCESIIGPVVATATTSSTIDADSTKATSDC